jgi:hypothetical protein
MRVKKTTFHVNAHAFDILDDGGKKIVRVEDEHTARQFAAAPEMLALLKALIAPWTQNDGGQCEYCDSLSDDHAAGCVVTQAREVIEEIG